MNDFELPIYKYKDEIIEKLKKNKVLIVESPTGSGKTTQIPRIVYEAGFTKSGRIGVTQPRRIATISIAEYISKHIGSPLGEEVGYKIRFEEVTSPSTKIKLMTDGVLLQELKKDTLLFEYDVIIIDEAHERSLNIDFILGLIKDILRQRDDFKVIISSATINTKAFSKYFNNAPVINIETITYPVQIIYNNPTSNAMNEMIMKIKEIVSALIKDKKEGDILMFLSGEREIKETIRELSQLNTKKDLILLPLYGKMSKELQERIFLPTPKNTRKIIVSTNIAETSITIENIKIVIDSGKVKINTFQMKTHTYSLQEVPISKASSTQRAGRAGRLSKGTCYRLYKREDYESRDEYQKEEIYRTDLSEVILRMSDIGIKDFTRFNFISKPLNKSIETATLILKSLGSINNKNELTEIGKYMIAFPLAPIHARALVEAMMHYPEAIYQTTIGLSFLSTNNVFLLPQNEEVEARRAHLKYKNNLGDLIGFINIFEDFIKSEDKEKFTKENYLDLQGFQEIVNVQMQLESIVSSFNIPIMYIREDEGYLKSIMCGMKDYICFKTSKNRYKTLKAQNIVIHPGSLINTDSVRYFVAGEIVETTKRYARSIGVLKKEWIKEIPEDTKQKETTKQESKKYEKSGTEHRKEKIKINNEITLARKSFKIKYRNNIPYLEIDLVEARELILKGINEEELKDLKNIKIKLKNDDLIVLNNKKLVEVLQIINGMESSWKLVNKFESKNVNIKEIDKIKDMLENTMNFTKSNNNSVSFLSIKTDYVGKFWIKPNNNFVVAIEESMETIQSIIDNENFIKELNPIKNTINKVYKKLNFFF